MTDEAKLYERITRHIDVFDDEYGARARSINDRGEAAIAAICDDFEQRLQAAQTRVAELERNNALMAEQLIARQE